jgi:hypothetical protein
VARRFRRSLSVAGSFVCRCLTSCAMLRFHLPTLPFSFLLFHQRTDGTWSIRPQIPLIVCCSLIRLFGCQASLVRDTGRGFLPCKAAGHQCCPVQRCLPATQDIRFICKNLSNVKYSHHSQTSTAGQASSGTRALFTLTPNQAARAMYARR